MRTQVLPPPVGFVEIITPPFPSGAIHSDSKGHDSPTAMFGSADAADHARAPAVGRVDARTSLSVSISTHSEGVAHATSSNADGATVTGADQVRGASARADPVAAEQSPNTANAAQLEATKQSRRRHMIGRTPAAQRSCVVVPRRYAYVLIRSGGEGVVSSDKGGPESTEGTDAPR